MKNYFFAWSESGAFGVILTMQLELSKVVVTTAAAEGMEVRIGLSREGQAVQVYTMGHWEGQPVIQ